MKPWLKKGEYELYQYLKEKKTINMPVTELSRVISKDNGDTNKRVKELEKKGYIIRNGTYIEVI